MIDYKAQYKDPRWQKKRLQILERDGWCCQICGNDEKCLNVHHFDYIPGRKIWEYDDRQLITLCEECHEIETQACHAVRKEILLAMSSVLFTHEITDLQYSLFNAEFCHAREVVISALSAALIVKEIQMPLIESYFAYIHSEKNRQDAASRFEQRSKVLDGRFGPYEVFPKKNHS